MPDADDETRSAAATKIKYQADWVDLQVRQAQDRGAFDNLPGLGKPLTSLGAEHDPDWWLKQLIERERITGVLPPALALRKENAELDSKLDQLSSEREVRDRVEEFNAAVRKALYSQYDGPPLITRQRDVDAEVAGWRERRKSRETPYHDDRSTPKAEPPSPPTWPRDLGVRWLGCLRPRGQRR